MRNTGLKMDSRTNILDAKTEVQYTGLYLLRKRENLLYSGHDVVSRVDVVSRSSRVDVVMW